MPVKLKLHAKTSFESYFGGKAAAGTMQTLINQIPPHKVFISGFLGNCAIMRHKLPAEVNIGLDLDSSVINIWRDAILSDDFKKNKLYLYNVDFLMWAYLFPSLGYNPKDVFIYLDPPYLFETRKSQRPIYNYEMTMEQHKVLLDKIIWLGCNVMLSHYPCELYSKGLEGWRYMEFESQTRAGRATEGLWMNYEEPTLLHDTTYYGNDYRHRELIKKRFNNAKKKVREMPPVERQRFFQYLSTQYGKEILLSNQH